MLGGKLFVTCLVTRPHYYARPMRFGSRGPRKFFSDTSPKCIDREGLGRRRTGTRQGYIFVTLQQVSLKLSIFTILGSLFRRCRRIFTN